MNEYRMTAKTLQARVYQHVHFMSFLISRNIGEFKKIVRNWLDIICARGVSGVFHHDNRDSFPLTGSRNAVSVSVLLPVYISMTLQSTNKQMHSMDSRSLYVFGQGGVKR